MTNKEHILKYKEYEKLGKFNEEINPIDWNDCYPVTSDFPYIPNWKLKLSYFFKNLFVISPFTKKQNKKIYRTIVCGRENLKNIGAAIVTCNHFDIFDCLAIRYALKDKHLKYCVAEFNNRKGFLGDMMRAGGILPLSGKYNVLKKFKHSVDYYLAHGKKVVFYPEQAMWYMFEKPRPFKEGAYHYAVRNDVPVIPLFVTFRGTGIVDSEGIEQKYLTVHIMPPIFAKKELSNKENIDYLKNLNYEMCRKKYEEIYNKKLEYEK